MPRFKTALVTGGAGFIGSHLADALIRRRIKVFIIDDLSTGKRENVNPNARFYKVSLASPQLPKLVKKLKPEIVFHQAAQINVRKSVENPAADAKTNIVGTLALAQAALEADAKKFVFASSGGAMYSDAMRPPYAEKQPAAPVSPYGIAKRAAEMYLEFFLNTHGLPYAALRYANVYGPRQNAEGEAGVVAIFAEQMLKGRQPVITGTGKQTRDFVYVDDVVRANLAAMNRNASGVFHIGTGKQTSINAMFKKIRKLADADIPERHGPAAAGEVMRSALDCRKARRVLGWQPKTGLDEGLEKTVKWFEKKGS